MSEHGSTIRLSRRSFLTAGGAAAGAVMLGFPAVLRPQPKTIKIGAVHPVTGGLAEIGQACRLGAQMGVDAVNFGQMIDALERKGLIKRRIDPDDRRARQLFVTPRAVGLRRRLRPSLLAAQERLLKPLVKAERAVFLGLLVRVIEANDAYARPGNGRRKPRRKSTSKPVK